MRKHIGKLIKKLALTHNACMDLQFRTLIVADLHQQVFGSGNSKKIM